MTEREARDKAWQEAKFKPPYNILGMSTEEAFFLGWDACLEWQRKRIAEHSCAFNRFADGTCSICGDKEE